MIRHVVMFKFKPDVPEADRKVFKVAQMLKAALWYFRKGVQFR